MPTLPLTTSPEHCATAVAALFGSVFDLLAGWRDEIVGTFGDSAAPAAIDEFVAARVLPVLTSDDPLLVGAGFIAAPDVVHGRGVHFAWWLGPLDAGPLFGSTTEPTRLDLTTRSHADYLRDVRSLEWYAVPATTQTTHVTGPYVDHLCSCDYILTLTMPVSIEDRMLGVVGADIAVRRLEREILPRLLTIDEPLALVNASGRVIISTSPTARPGSLLGGAVEQFVCAGTPLAIDRLP
ncbi:MAG: cache domain-containing protein [Leifsonia sp.]